MLKFLAAAWNVLVFLWKYIKPVYADMMEIIAQVKASGLTDTAARAKVIQLVTDKLQCRGLAKIPDNVMNASIELCYQIYLARQGDRKV